MRGSPLIHCLICAIAFALIAVPLARMTFARPAVTMQRQPARAATTDATDARHAFIRIRYAHTPQSLSLKFENRELVTAATKNEEPGTKNQIIETSTNLPKTAESLELALSVQWPDGTPDTAITVEIEPDELESRSETRWSSGPRLEEILSFKW